MLLIRSSWILTTLEDSAPGRLAAEHGSVCSFMSAKLKETRDDIEWI